MYSKTKEENLNRLILVLDILKKHSLFAKLSKCDFMKNDIGYLGHIIRDDCTEVNPKKIDAVKDWEAPQNMKKGHRFHGRPRKLCKCVIVSQSIVQLLQKIRKRFATVAPTSSYKYYTERYSLRVATNRRESF